MGKLQEPSFNSGEIGGNMPNSMTRPSDALRIAQEQITLVEKLRAGKELSPEELARLSEIGNHIVEIADSLNFDPVTGLANLGAAKEKIAEILGNSEADPSAIMRFDLTGFKAVNDILGHSIGDEFIVAFADSLRRNVRTSIPTLSPPWKQHVTDRGTDYVARDVDWIHAHEHGDEYCVVLTGLRKDMDLIQFAKEKLGEILSDKEATESGKDSKLLELIKRHSLALHGIDRRGRKIEGFGARVNIIWIDGEDSTVESLLQAADTSTNHVAEEVCRYTDKDGFQRSDIYKLNNLVYLQKQQIESEKWAVNLDITVNVADEIATLILTGDLVNHGAAKKLEEVLIKYVKEDQVKYLIVDLSNVKRADHLCLDTIDQADNLSRYLKKGRINVIAPPNRKVRTFIEDNHLSGFRIFDNPEEIDADIVKNNDEYLKHKREYNIDLPSKDELLESIESNFVDSDGSHLLMTYSIVPNLSGVNPWKDEIFGSDYTRAEYVDDVIVPFYKEMEERLNGRAFQMGDTAEFALLLDGEFGAKPNKVIRKKALAALNDINIWEIMKKNKIWKITFRVGTANLVRQEYKTAEEALAFGSDREIGYELSYIKFLDSCQVMELPGGKRISDHPYKH